MRRTTQIALLAGLISLAAAPAALGAVKSTGTWVMPDLKGESYKKVLVLARISEESAKRILEDSVVKQLKKQGVEAVTAYQVLAPEDLASKEALTAKAEQLGVDAGILFTVLGERTEVKSGSNAYASVGVPVSVGPFGMFLGTSVPLGGGPSTVKKVGVKAEFHKRSGGDPLWIGNYETDLKGGANAEADRLASMTTKALKKAGVFKKK